MGRTLHYQVLNPDQLTDAHLETLLGVAKCHSDEPAACVPEREWSLPAAAVVCHKRLECWRKGVLEWLSDRGIEDLRN